MDLGTPLTITPSIKDGDWADLGDRLDMDASDGARIIRVGNLPSGMQSGRPSFQLAAQLADGRVVIVETSWQLMRGALRALDVVWPEED
jgi:fructose-1-phosphate kinase PfkB-like protein